VSIERMTKSMERPVDGAQRLRALERANRVRSARSGIKAQIAAGRLTAAQVILSARWEIERMPIAEVLGSQPQWGVVRSRGFLARVHMAENKTVGSMTERQRLTVAAALSRGPIASFAGRPA
jgi:hypothetical protein